MRKLDTLGHRIGAGFLILTLILGAAVFVTIRQVSQISLLSERVEHIRTPMAQASMAMLTGIYETISQLRGWILFGDDAFMDKWHEAWQRIDKTGENLERLNQTWANPSIEDVWRDIELKLDIFRDHQRTAIALIQKQEVASALDMLETKTLPLTGSILALFTKMVHDQNTSVMEGLAQGNQSIRALQGVEWMLLGVGMTLACAIGFLITRGVTGPIKEAIYAARRIAEEDFSFDVQLRGTLEIEALGSALARMKNSLQKRAWMITSQIGLLESMAGEKTIKELAHGILQVLTEKIGGHLAAFYLCHEEQLIPIAGYAHHGEQWMGAKYHLGEGLIGQAALTKQQIHLTQIPGGYFTIDSGLGKMAPSEILIVPVIFGDCVICVIECATKDRFTPEYMELVRYIEKNIGAAVNLCVSNEKVKSLLKDVRSQAKALEQSNERLKQKTQETESQRKELQQTYEELERQQVVLEDRQEKLEALTRELQISNDEIDKKARETEKTSRYKSEFLTNMSHELRTPLNSIMILSQLLQENGDGRLTKGQVDNAKTIHAAGRDLLNLINDILDLSKVEAGKMTLRIAPFSIQDVSENIRRTFAEQMRAKGLGFTIVVEDHFPETIVSDQGRLEQILRNLVSNALKFTDTGRVTVRYARPRQKETHVLCKDPQTCIAISVEDTGAGIPKDKRDVIFEAFKQLDGSLSRKHEGTGLGLSISQSLAHRLGGYVFLETPLEERGNTFTVILPETIALSEEDCDTERIASELLPPRTAHEKQVSAQAASPSKEPPQDNRNHISKDSRVVLVIEDDETFARVLIDQCRKHGFQCRHTLTGEEGFADARTIKPCAIILDLCLSEADGLTILEKLKTNPETRHIPVHVISEESRKLAVMNLGAVGFLEKPVSREDLQQVFQDIEYMAERRVKNVLLLDDNDEERNTIGRLIADANVKIQSTGSPEQALAYLRRHRYDCLILDPTLKSGSGYDVLDAFQTNTSWQKTPVIVCTGRNLTQETSQKLQEYSHNMIIKGASPSERLLSEVALFLHRVEEHLPKEHGKLLTQSLIGPETFKNTKILIIDDVRSIYALRHALLAYGFEITVGYTGKEALSFLSDDPNIQCVLMDVMMPDMDGLETIRAIRRDPRLKKLPVIALTAKAVAQDRENCLKAGASDYLVKPVDVDQLMSLLKAWLS